MSKTAITPSDYLVNFLPVVLWAGFIYYLSAQQVLPSFALNTWDFLFKKTAHMFVYGVLFLLLFRAFKQTVGLVGYKAWVIPLALTIAYAIFDEAHQTLTPGRTGTLRDIGFDALGVSLVLMRKFGYI
jgi:VanZ family protein